MGTLDIIAGCAETRNADFYARAMRAVSGVHGEVAEVVRTRISLAQVCSESALGVARRIQDICGDIELHWSDPERVQLKLLLQHWVVFITDNYTRTTVYGLREVGTDEVRYIGQTNQPLKHRLRAHRNDVRNMALPKTQWIKQLRNSGSSVEIVELEKDAVYNLSETQHILSHQSRGHRLLNVLVCGSVVCNDGVKTVTKTIRKPISNETRSKLSEISKKQVPTEETKRGVSAGLKGRKLSEEHRRKLAMTSADFSKNNPHSHPTRGKSMGPMSKERKNRLSASLKKYFKENPKLPVSEETRSRLSAASIKMWETRPRKLDLPEDERGARKEHMANLFKKTRYMKDHH